jgi:uncharacterized protein (UPF0332 family)
MRISTHSCAIKMFPKDFEKQWDFFMKKQRFWNSEFFLKNAC